MPAKTVESRKGRPLALGGPLFVALFIAELVLVGLLATSPFPMPDTPATLTADYYQENAAALVAGGVLQGLAAGALLVFARCVAAFVRRDAGEGDRPARIVAGFGVLAAGLLATSAVISGTLVLVAGGGDLSLVGGLRSLNFLAGGTLHVAALGIFVGSASIAARRTKTLPRWISRLGILAAAPAILSLASLGFFVATPLIPLGRLLCFVWCAAAGLVLAFGGRPDPDAKG